LDAKHTPLIRVEDESGNCALHSLQVSVLLEKRSDRASVKPAVTLRPRSPDSRTLAAIEHAELNHGKVCSSSHDSSERIDLTNDRPFGDATDCRIARHLPDRFESACYQPDPGSEACGSDGRFGAGMARADDYDVEFGFKVLGWPHTLKDKRRKWISE